MPVDFADTQRAAPKARVLAALRASRADFEVMLASEEHAAVQQRNRDEGKGMRKYRPKPSLLAPLGKAADDVAQYEAWLREAEALGQRTQRFATAALAELARGARQGDGRGSTSGAKAGPPAAAAAAAGEPRA